LLPSALTPAPRTLSLHDALPIYAFEAQCFVISACSYQPADEVPDSFPYKQRTNWDWANGGSSIVDPYGNYVVEPVYDQETLIVRSEEHTSELQSRFDLVCRLLLE